MAQFTDIDRENGLDCYDPENRVFPQFARFAGSPNLNKRDVLLILKWKLGMIKDRHSVTVSDRNMLLINQAISDAAKSDLESRVGALNALASVPEIGLAVASAILTLCYPETFTIIDQRVLEILNLFPPTLPANKRILYNTDDWTASDYFSDFLPIVREQSRDLRCTLRIADQALWGLSVSRRIERVIDMSDKEQGQEENQKKTNVV
jgi:hypothetical protein